MRVATITSIAIFAAATGAFAQDEVLRKQTLEIATRVPFEKTMTGAPYSAETLVEGVQTLADGNRIVRKTTGRVYRDGEGRTRREEDAVNATAKNPATGVVTTVARTNISIVDPVGGFSYSLDPDRKIAWRTPIGVAGGIMNKIEERRVEDVKLAVERTLAEKIAAEKAATEGAGGMVARGGSGGAVRMRTPNGDVGYAIVPNPGPLERKTLEGVTVEGRKTTTTIPAGQIGNEQPLTIVSEEWRSPELNVLVMTRYLDPRTGESTYRLTNIIRAEPDRSLFMVPPDYEIRESGIRKLLEAKK